MSDDRRQPERRRRHRGGRRIADLASHDEAFITIDQFATYLKVDYRTVKAMWIEPGALVAYNFEGIWRIKVSDAVDFVARNRLSPAQPSANPS